MEISTQNAKCMAMSVSPKQERANVETSLPFRSVRDAVSMFGEARTGQKQKVLEKRITKGTEMQQALRELTDMREQLKYANEAKSEVLLELVEARKTIAEMNQKAQYGRTSKEALDSTVQKHVAVNASLDGDEEAELEILRRDLENLRQELLECKAARRREEDFPAQIILEGNKGAMSISAAKDIEERIKKSPNPSLTVAEQHELECLKAELANAKENKDKASREAAEALATLKKVRSELESRRLSEMNAISSVTLVSIELHEAKENLINALGAAISVKDELQIVRQELVDLRESLATATAATLTVEPNKIKPELVAFSAAGVKASDTVSHLTHALQKSIFDTEAVKLEADTTREELQTVRRNKEQGEATAEAAGSKCQTCSRQLDAATFYDRVNPEQIKGFSEIIAVVSQEEYDALKRKMEERDQLASMQVSLALAEVEALRVDGQKHQQRLRASNEELEEMRKATKAHSMQVSAALFEVAALKMNEQELHQRLRASDEELEEMKRATKAQTRQLSAALAEVEALKMNEQELQQMLRASNEELEEMRKATTATSRQVSAALAEVDALKMNEQELQQMLRASDEELEEMREATTAASRQVSAALAEVEALRANEQKLQQTLRTSDEELGEMREALKAASGQVSAALAEVEELRVNGQELQHRLRASNEELGEMRKARKQALHMVEMAEAAKDAVESELRRLRAGEQRRKSVEIAVIQQPREQPYIADENGDKSFSFGTTYNTIPLSTVLNMKIPSKKEHRRKAIGKSVTVKKKSTILPLLGGYLVKK